MRRISVVLAVCATSMFFVSAADAQDDSGRAILQKAADFVANMTKWTVDFEVLFDAQVDEEVEKFTTDYTVAMSQPSDAMVHMNNQYVGIWMYTSATENTRYLPELEQYIVDPGRMAPSKLIQSASNNVTLPALAMFSEFMKDAPLGIVFNSEDPITLVGQESVNGVACDHLRFMYTDYECDIWVAQGDEPLLHRIVPDVSVLSERIAASGSEVKKFLVQLDVLHWQQNSVEADLLKFSAKEGMDKVAQFIAPPPPSAAEQLIGKLAPVVELKTLDGKDFNVSEKKGKEIVVLDFWATWCGPCRMGMPILSKVTSEFADKGVRMYAVNLREGTDQINPFLESTGLELNVVLDTDGEMGDAFMAESIPMMVIVGKDGLVKKVHIGVTPNYEEEIRAELTALTQ